MKLNIDPTQVGAEGTRMKIPDWAGRAQEALPASSGTVMDKLSSSNEETTRIRGVKTKQDSSTFNPSGIMASGYHDHPVTLDPSEISNWAQDFVPVEDEPDVTDWMVAAQAHTVIMEARANEYNRAGSLMDVAAGDPFQPGVSTNSMAFKSVRGSQAEQQGEVDLVLANGDETSISVPGAEPIITKNSLNWAVGSNFQEQQWVGAGYSVEELTNNPSDPIGFPTVAGNTGPLFVGHKPSRPSVLNRASVTIQSNQAQSVDFKLRSSRNYNRVIRSFSQDIPKGQSTTTYRVVALGIEPMALEINPQDGTQAVLTDYSVFP